MNERIKQLAVTAKEYAKEFNFQHEVFERKFAELLVQECMQQCTQVWYDANNETEPESSDLRTIGIKIGVKQGSIKCINQIKQHFGVKL